jgi:hypothetical protein
MALAFSGFPKALEARSQRPDAVEFAGLQGAAIYVPKTSFPSG